MKRALGTLLTAVVVATTLGVAQPASAASSWKNNDYRYRDDYRNHSRIIRDRDYFYRNTNNYNRWHRDFVDFRNGQILVCQELDRNWGYGNEALLCFRLNN